MFIAFLIISLIIFVISFICFCLPVLYIADRKTTKIIAIILCFILSFCLGKIAYNGALTEINEWNNGYCSKCGEPWNLLEIERSGRYGQYEHRYYICNKCGEVICQTGD